MKGPVLPAERLAEMDRLAVEIEKDLEGHQVPVKKQARLNPSRHSSSMNQLRKRKKRFEDIIEASNLPENAKSYVSECRIVCWWMRSREAVLRAALNEIHSATFSWPKDEPYETELLKEVNRIAADALAAS